MQKFSAIALLGASKAAIGPYAVTTWPKFGTAAVPTGATEIVGDTIQPGFNYNISTLTATVGLTRGYRSDFIVAPTQNNTAATANGTNAAGAIGAIVAQTTTRTWYPTSEVLIGTFMDITLVPVTIALSAAANGAKFGVCKNVTVATNCTAICTTLGTSASPASTTYTVKILKARIATQISQTAQVSIVAPLDNAATPLFHLTYFTWNTDFFMAAMYQSQQPTVAVTTGASWCSNMDTSLAIDGTTATVLDIAYGYTGRTKCSWQVTAADGTVGHTFTVTQADTLTSNVFWAEWYGSSALGTNAQLPVAGNADYFIGAYAVMTNGGLFLNPAKSITIPTAGTVAFAATVAAGSLTVEATGFAPVVSYTDAGLYVAGTIGLLNYFPGAAGDYKETQVSTIDQLQLSSMYNMYSSQVSSYNTANNSYETLRKTYDEALTKETARLADALKAAFDPKIAVPTRPCSPTRPDEYSGTYLDLGSSAAYTATLTLMGKRANIKSYIGAANVLNDLPNANAAVKKGAIYLTNTAGTIGTSVGHVFGRLGQGSDTVEAGLNPFLWMTATTTKAGMLLGFYPTTDADTGVLATKAVQISFRSKTWTALSAFNKPGRPDAPSEPMKAGASMLALGATSALVLATLA